MIKKSNTLIKICNIACVVAMIAMLVVMCLPGWDYTRVEIEEDIVKEPDTGKLVFVETEHVSEDNASIMELTWLTYDNQDLADKIIDDDLKEFMAAGGRRRDHSKGVALNAIVVMPFLVTLLSVFGIVFSLWKMNATWTSLFPLISGGYGVFVLLTEPMYKSNNSYTITLIMAIVLLAVALTLFVQCATRIVKWFAVKK